MPSRKNSRTAIMAIDPGPKQSAWVLYDDGRVLACDIVPNADVLRELDLDPEIATVVCEWIESFGMAVGKDVFHTCRWVGRFEQMATASDMDFHRIGRRDIKLHLCNSARAKDANVRQALIDKFPATGGGKTPQVGTKAKPGPLYGVKSHIWSALAVAVTWREQYEQKMDEACAGMLAEQRTEAT